MENNDIDKIFKEGLEQTLSNQYDENNWKALEERLGKKNNSRKILFFSLFASTVAACLLIVFVLNKNNPMINNSMENIVAKNHQIDSIIEEVQNELIIDTPASALANNNKVSTFDYTKPIRLPIPREEYALDSLKTSNQYSDENIKDENLSSYVTNTIRNNETNVTDTSSMVEILLPEMHTNIEDVPNESTLQGVDENKTRLKGSFTILAALDLTEVQGAGRQKVSEHIGVLYTHPLTKRLSMSSGVLYSRKKYESPYSFYRPEKPYVGSHPPTTVSAVCDVVSLPILVNYKIFHAKSYSITASSGLSSYFMTKEDYNFNYDGEGYEPYISNYTIKGKNQHYFGVADISVSFDRKINNKWSLGIRPFVQLPLTGIGYGRTNLQSKGVAVSFGIAP